MAEQRTFVTTGQSATSTGREYLPTPGGVLTIRDSSGGLDDDVTDLLGTPVANLNLASGVLGESLATPYGQNRYTANAAGPGGMQTAKGFTGQYQDTSMPGSSGLDYFNARYYDPAIGRFTSADDAQPGLGDPLGLDNYAYVGGQVETATDPSGHECDSASIAPGITAVVNAVAGLFGGGGVASAATCGGGELGALPGDLGGDGTVQNGDPNGVCDEACQQVRAWENQPWVEDLGKDLAADDAEARMLRQEAQAEARAQAADGQPDPQNPPNTGTGDTGSSGSTGSTNDTSSTPRSGNTPTGSGVEPSTGGTVPEGTEVSGDQGSQTTRLYHGTNSVSARDIMQNGVKPPDPSKPFYMTPTGQVAADVGSSRVTPAAPYVTVLQTDVPNSLISDLEARNLLYIGEMFRPGSGIFEYVFKTQEAWDALNQVAQWIVRITNDPLGP